MSSTTDRRPHVAVLGMLGVVFSPRPFLEPALRRGLRVTWIAPGEPGEWLRERVDHAVDLAELGEEGALRALDAIHAETPIDAVISFVEDNVVLAGRIAERFGIATHGVAAAVRTTDKWEMRKALAAGGVPVPGFARVETREAFDAAVAEFGWPCVVKPIRSSGSRGVRVVHDRAGAAEAWEWTRAVSRHDCGREDILVEQYAGGVEYSAEVIVAEGEVAFCSITEKLLIGGDFRDEAGHLHPHRFDGETMDEVRRVVQATVAAVGVRRGGCHVEFKVDGGRVMVIEIASRLGGGGIPSLVRFATGADLVDLVYASSLGEPVTIPADRGMYAGVRFATLTERRVVHSARVSPAVRALPGVVQAEVFCETGVEIGPELSGGQRIGLVIARGRERGALLDTLERAEARILADALAPAESPLVAA
jgi:cysteine synthase A